MATMSQAEVMSLIQSQYPALWPLINKPGVLDVLTQAVENNWNQARLQAALEATPYFQQTPEGQRQIDVLAATDPATYQQRANNYATIIHNTMAQLGLPDPGLPFLASAMFNNWDESQIRMHMVAQDLQGGPSQLQGGGGQIGDEMATLRGQANNYGLPMSDQSLFSYAAQIAGGQLTTEDFNAYVQNQAASLYPTIAPAIQRGITVRQYVAPYLEIARQELGIDPTTVDLTQPQWNVMLDSKQQDGTRAPMTLSDWTRTIRSDPQYGYDNTTGARTQAAQFATQILNQFGNI